MKKDQLVWFVSRVGLSLFVYVAIFYFVFGWSLNYYEGDSLNYHIPIAKAFLDHSVINPNHIAGVPFLKFSPGSSEIIISLLMILKIPINIYNVIGSIFLLLSSYFVARRFNLGKDYSLLFAVTIIGLNIVSRWINTQIIDLWFTGWYFLTLGLLQKPQKNIKYFVFLGLTSGMFIGSKYSGPLFASILFIFYFKVILKNLNIKRFLSFLIPFTITGLSWYLRNLYFAKNPFYPQPFLFFKGDYFPILSAPVWKSTFITKGGEIRFFNAIIAEFKLFAVLVFTPLALLFKKINSSSFRVLILIGLLNLLIYMFLPSDKFYNIAVSSFRYSLPATFTLILGIFVIAKKYNKENIIAILSLVNFMIAPVYIYKPKLLIITLPLVFIIFYPNEFWKTVKGKSLLIRRR